ncbi:hypothetical protein GCM10009687_35060 [Asanoa iriomotensis]|uniref:Alkylmercury lyase-like protein n=2 Tax=Asanoa iriomotensis TaxID=234613 RepID=A0ABQ4CD30_9ACTN|nr:hypothetical protein Air01nite_67780 [Asanoa iriomotensis]
MGSRRFGAADQALFDVVARRGADNAALIQGACQALIDGLDSPALRDLAGASVRDRPTDVHELVVAALAELDIPYPGTIVGPLARRPGVDVLRLDIGPADDGSFQVRVHVNGAEMTSAGAGLGMDPYDILIPTNRLVATAVPTRSPIARCGCGVYGCGSTDIAIVRDGDLVHWDWLLEMPMGRGVSFAAADYDAEVDRVARDHSWETPARTAGRLVLTDLDYDRLAAFGLKPSWVANHYRYPERFLVALTIRDDYQVFVTTPWRGRGPEELARAVHATLAAPPAKWNATWHPTRPALTGPPAIAGRSWRRERI